ncbi:flagellar biosynthetic protein FliR [Nesterenkonia lutea]|uniref:Flagellar biosynthetic protein FliR n=1 Tax=Nesterenkonia lutea TaxID=272919 RepID=A0ABR9JFA3_9MICC|nr:flagellar biosynthetic protein FliR [Nesterenkonia lutea]MBE1524618.1 flagellar biosynthetic protein FliR [Nesterenkonia lutea]
MEFTLPLAWLEATMLAAVRVTAFIVIAPPFSHGSVPMRIRAAMGAALALVVAPRAVADYVPMDTGGFIAALLLEILAGAALGFLVMLLFAAVQSAGGLIDLFGGFQLAMAFDPGSQINGAQFTRLFHFAAIALLVASDGYQLILAGLFRSFDALPLGAEISLAALAENSLTGFTEMFMAAVQIAGPLLVVLFLADAGLGLLTRVAPALNAFSLGFPLKIFLTLTLAGTVFVVLPAAVSTLVQSGLRAFNGVI